MSMSLHLALLLGDFPKARRLIRRRIEINKPDEDGNTPLMLSSRHPRRESLTQLLLAAGAIVDMQNETGETALMQAVRNADNQENVSILIHGKADIGIMTRYG